MHSKPDINKLTEDAEAVHREYESAKSLESQASIIFQLDFRYEIKWSDKMHGTERRSTARQHDKGLPELDDELQSVLRGSFKKLRNTLAMAVHPDRHGGDINMEQEFKEIQEAYEYGDITKLVETAGRHNIDIDLSEADVRALNKVMNHQRGYIRSVRQSFKWAWMECSRNNEDRKTAWGVLDINGSEFSLWLMDSGYSLEQLELECIERRKNMYKNDINTKPRKKSRSQRIFRFLLNS